MNKRSMYLIIAATLILVGASLYSLINLNPGDKPRPIKHVSSQGDADIGGKFLLEDVNGNKVSDKDLEGKISLVYFGFSHCPDTCPMSLENMAKVLNMLSTNELTKIKPIFVSIDPDRDNKIKLKEYAEHFHPKIIALTGSDKRIKEAMDNYKIYSQKVDGAAEGNYMLNHTSLTYLMDKKGKYFAHFSPQAKPTDILVKIKQALAK